MPPDPLEVSFGPDPLLQFVAASQDPTSALAESIDKQEPQIPEPVPPGEELGLADALVVGDRALAEAHLGRADRLQLDLLREGHPGLAGTYPAQAGAAEDPHPRLAVGDPTPEEEARRPGQ